MLDDFRRSANPILPEKVKPEDDLIEKRDSLALDLDEKTFIKRSRSLIDDSVRFYNTKYNLDERRETNEKYLWGRQVQDLSLQNYQAEYLDNIIYDAEKYLKSIAISRRPEITVTPGNKSEESKLLSRELSKHLNNDQEKRSRKQILALAFKHLPAYFIAAIKPFWNPEKGPKGNYDFRVVNPKNLILDHRATSLDTSQMQFIAESNEYSVKELVMLFPDKEEKLYQELRKNGVFDEKKNETNADGMNSIVKCFEMWFTEYQKNGDKYEKIEGVGWFYKNLLLSIIKDPNYDWTGKKQLFKYDYKIEEQEIRDSIYNGTDLNTLPGFSEREVFKNHFENPRKPYILIGYDQWGETPLDQTSRIEQALLLQDNLDKRESQKTDMLNRSRGKHIFSTEAGLKSEDVEEMDMANPDEDIIVEGKVNDVHGFIAGEQPSVAVIQDTVESRNRIFDKIGINPTLRGEIASDVATTNQIARESGFTGIDDLTDDTINYAAEQIGNWTLQFMKLRWTPDHYTRAMGKNGEAIFEKIDQDVVEDGMEVFISASGVDKLKAEQKAFDMAKVKMSDPLTFFEDIGVEDPKTKAEKTMLFMLNPAAYMEKFIVSQDESIQDTQNLANKLGGGVAPDAAQDILLLQQGQVPPVPEQVTPEYLDTILKFVNSPEFEQVLINYPDNAQAILDWVTQVSDLAAQGGQQPQQGAAPQQPPQVPQIGGGNEDVGPISSQPNPGDTTRVSALPPTR